MSLAFLFLIAIAVGSFAGIMAYLITYNEYQHHFKGKRVFNESFKSGLVAFIFFFILTLVIAIILHRLFK